MSNLEAVLEVARKLSPKERRQLTARLLEESEAPFPARRAEKLEAMRAAAGDELYLADLAATVEDF